LPDHQHKSEDWTPGGRKYRGTRSDAAIRANGGIAARAAVLAPSGRFLQKFTQSQAIS
jgi:hypothetical protein